MNSNLKILITGGCGFIGRRLISVLNSNGTGRITVLDNESTATHAHIDGLNIERFIRGDIRDAKIVYEAVAGQDAIIHLAAQTGVIPSIETPEIDFDVNVRGGFELLRAAAAHRVGSFIFASSAAPVGDHPPPFHEDLPCNPVSPYGASKLAMEGYCSAFRHSLGLNAVVLRFSNCYGPGSDHKSSVVAQFIKEILAGEEITIYGDGQQTRDFIFVDDLARGLELAMLRAAEADSALFQLSTATETSVNDLVASLEGLASSCGIEVKTRYAAARAGEIVRNYSRNEKFVKTFNFRPETPFDIGLERTWRYFTELKNTQIA